MVHGSSDRCLLIATVTDLTQRHPTGWLHGGSEMANPHNVIIDDNAANWLRWGNLVMTWVVTPSSSPTTVAELRTAMANANVTGTVKGNPNRSVQVLPYTGDSIIIPVPTPAMVQKDDDELKNIFNTSPVGQRYYPLPVFYNDIFNNPAKKNFNTEPQMIDMARRRLGEYVINECC
jgi:hypothetical protein